jgi:thiamine biosynthesis protein ThiS
VQVHVNGEPREITDGSTISDVLAELNLSVRHVAVEVNCEIVPRAKHGGHVLEEGDRLEIVTLVGGG